MARLRTTRRLVLVLVAGAVTVLAAGPAAAHVTVSAQGEATQGSFARLVFNVPNEQDAAATTGLEVTFPDDQPIPNVSVRPEPGWTYQVETTTFDPPRDVEGREVTEAVSTITWSGGAIQPGEFDQFVVSAGPLPEVDELVFKVVQTYDNGDQVRWIEEASETGEEPEFPAPVLTLAESPPEGDPGADTTENVASDDAAALDTSGLADEDDLDSVKTLAIIAIVVGAIGVVLAGVALVRRRTG